MLPPPGGCWGVMEQGGSIQVILDLGPGCWTGFLQVFYNHEELEVSVPPVTSPAHLPVEQQGRDSWGEMLPPPQHCAIQHN